MELLNALASVVVECKNLKVRINAASALGCANDRVCYGQVKTFVAVCEGLIAALHNVENIKEFSELRYKESLTEQVIFTAHLIFKFKILFSTVYNDVFHCHFQDL